MSKADRRKLRRERRKLKALQETQQVRVVETELSVFAQVLQQWKGPLPPPEWLRDYEETIPGMGDRLFTCFEKQVDHRIRIESAVVHGNTTAQKTGQWLAFIIALVVLAFAFYLASLGHVGWGIGVVLGEALGLAGLFIYGRQSQKAERMGKMAQLVARQ